MKFIVAFLATAVSAHAIACTPAAQINSKIVRVKETATSCKVFLSTDVKTFNVSNACPLEFSEIMSEGIEVSAAKGVECSQYLKGGEVNSTVVRDDKGVITLEMFAKKQ